MPITVDKNEERAKQLVEGGGLKSDTLMRRQRNADDFDSFVKSNCGTSLQVLVESEDVTQLEKYLIDYFERVRVKKKDETTGEEKIELPKKKIHWKQPKVDSRIGSF